MNKGILNPTKRLKIMDAEFSKGDFLESPIQKLDENSLICIFKKLPATYLVRAERVCKNWQKLAKQSWNGLKKLTITPKHLGMTTLGTSHRCKFIDDHVVEQVLKRCGKYLKEIDIIKIRPDV